MIHPSPGTDFRLFIAFGNRPAFLAGVDAASGHYVRPNSIGVGFSRA